MKIVHICLAASYVEGFGYQENILTQLHAQMGHSVTVLTTDRTFNSKYERTIRENFDYVNEFGIHVKTLTRNTKYWIYRFGMFNGVYEELDKVKPDIIFIHGGQFYALKNVIEYCKKNRNVKLYIDQHGDYYNMHVNTWKEKIVHHHIYGHWMRKAIHYTEKYWGVTPWRCQFLHEVYRIPENKTGLLVMGGDDRYIHFDKLSEIRNDIRRSLNLADDDFVVITGGKIDKTKNIHLLIGAIRDIDFEQVKLIVFGQPNDEMQDEIESLSEDKHIRYIGWLDSTKAYDYFMASDLAVFPGTHSVLWEQACACGLPGLFKDWHGMHHVNVNGSAEFLKEDSADEMKSKITELYQDKTKYMKMKNAAWEYARNEFSYMEIAKRAIGL